MEIKKWREEMMKYFPGLVLPAEIGLSVICQLFIEDITNPFGMVFVDVPSSGKTITLNFFSEASDYIYTTDNFTAASLVTHASNVKKEELEKIDLLPKIKNKVLMVRDLSTIFGMRDDDLLRTMGILTRVFDGEGLKTEGGVHGTRGYEGDFLFMFLAASTPISPRVWRVMGNFGARLFFLNLNIKAKSEEELAGQLCSELSVKNMERECRRTTKDFIEELSKREIGKAWRFENENRDLLKEIGKISKFVAALRGVINVWKDSSGTEGINHTIPVVEMPDRINQCLYNLARGHAFLCKRNFLEDEDLTIVLKVALSSAPLERVKLFNLLIKNKGSLDVDMVSEGMNCSVSTARNHMWALRHLGIVKFDSYAISSCGRPREFVRLKEDFSWFLSDRFKDLNKLIEQDMKKSVLKKQAEYLLQEDAIEKAEDAPELR